MPVQIEKGGPKKTAKNATSTETVTKKTPEGAEETVKDEVEVSDELSEISGGGPWAHVDVEVGATIPTQQYANVKVAVRVSVPCAVDDIDETYEMAKEWAVDRMSALADEAVE